MYKPHDLKCSNQNTNLLANAGGAAITVVMNSNNKFPLAEIHYGQSIMNMRNQHPIPWQDFEGAKKWTNKPFDCLHSFVTHYLGSFIRTLFGEGLRIERPGSQS
jgi:hypothetical protein